MKRKNIGSRLRYEVFSRDGFTCRYCGRKPPEVKLNADHIQPVALGGPTTKQNLATSCEECNAGKGARTPDCGALRGFWLDEDFIRDYEPMDFYSCDPYITATFGPICE